jgi:hypothetical protein
MIFADIRIQTRVFLWYGSESIRQWFNFEIKSASISFKTLFGYGSDKKVRKRSITLSAVVCGRFVLEAGQWWEIMLNIRPQQAGYDPRGGGTVWSQGGTAGQSQVTLFILT